MRLPALLLALLAAGCSGAPAQLAHPAAQSGIMLKGSGEFSTNDPDIITYDRGLVPVGAQVNVTSESTSGRTLTSLVVENFRPGRAYGAHLHTKPCGTKGEDAGPHYQHVPGQVSTASEVWLDFTTDESGAGHASARHDWSLDSTRLPRSLIVHARPTTTSGPDIGMAGDRAACLTLK